MRWTFLLLIPFLLATGCSSHNLPAVKDVAQIRLTVTNMPDQQVDPKAAPRVVNLNEQKDIVEMMDYLNTINWSQSGQDMAVMGMPQPDGGIVLTTKAGDTHEFGFYWDGKFTLVRANRLIRGGDTDKLKQLVKRVCK